METASPLGGLLLLGGGSTAELLLLTGKGIEELELGGGVTSELEGGGVTTELEGGGVTTELLTGKGEEELVGGTSLELPGKGAAELLEGSGLFDAYSTIAASKESEFWVMAVVSLFLPVAISKTTSLSSSGFTISPLPQDISEKDARIPTVKNALENTLVYISTPILLGQSKTCSVTI